MEQGNLAVLAMTERSSSADRHYSGQYKDFQHSCSAQLYYIFVLKKKTLDYIFYNRFGLLGFKQPWPPF